MWELVNVDVIFGLMEVDIVVGDKVVVCSQLVKLFVIDNVLLNIQWCVVLVQVQFGDIVVVQWMFNKLILQVKFQLLLMESVMVLCDGVKFEVQVGDLMQVLEIYKDVMVVFGVIMMCLQDNDIFI